MCIHITKQSLYWDILGKSSLPHLSVPEPITCETVDTYPLLQPQGPLTLHKTLLSQLFSFSWLFHPIVAVRHKLPGFLWQIHSITPTPSYLGLPQIFFNVSPRSLLSQGPFLFLILNSALGWILCTSCPKPSPFPHQNPLFFYHILKHCCKDLPFTIRFLNYSSLQYLLSQVLPIHSTKLLCFALPPAHTANLDILPHREETPALTHTP